MQTLIRVVKTQAGRRTILILAAALAAGCANLNDRPPLPASVAPDAAKAYVYGRFKLDPPAWATGIPEQRRP